MGGYRRPKAYPELSGLAASELKSNFPQKCGFESGAKNIVFG